MPLNQHGFCEHYCSKPTSNIDHAGFCGSSSEYRREGSTDCRGCKGIVLCRYLLNFNENLLTILKYTSIFQTHQFMTFISRI